MDHWRSTNESSRALLTAADREHGSRPRAAENRGPKQPRRERDHVAAKGSEQPIEPERDRREPIGDDSAMKQIETRKSRRLRRTDGTDVPTRDESGAAPQATERRRRGSKTRRTTPSRDRARRPPEPLESHRSHSGQNATANEAENRGDRPSRQRRQRPRTPSRTRSDPSGNAAAKRKKEVDSRMQRAVPRAASSRPGRAQSRSDGTAVCRLEIPLGHPAARFFEPDGTPFEVEHEREFVAGPGITAPRAIDPASGDETIVGANLLPVGEENPPVHVGPSNLASFLRRAAKRFDAETAAVPRGTKSESGATTEHAKNPTTVRPREQDEAEQVAAQ